MRFSHSVALLILVSVFFCAGIATVRAASCDGEACNSSVGGCILTNIVIETLCCKDFDGHMPAHCVTCSRDYYRCGFVYEAGPAYNCVNPEDACQQ